MAVSDENGATPRPQQRRAPRFRYFGAIFLSWKGPGGRNFVMGRCFDISESGLGVEVANRISVDTEVTVRAEWANLDNAAIVRRLTQQGGVFQLGLELKEPFPPEILEKLIGPASE